MISFTDAQVDQAIDSAPVEVRELIEEGTLVRAVLETAKKNALHVDHIGVSIPLARNMLIGLLSPTQFVSELKEAGVAESSANAILQDLNTKIFKPLYEKTRGKESAPSKEPSATAVKSAGTPAPAQTTAPIAQKPVAKTEPSTPLVVPAVHKNTTLVTSSPAPIQTPVAKTPIIPKTFIKQMPSAPTTLAPIKTPTTVPSVADSLKVSPVVPEVPKSLPPLDATKSAPIPHLPQVPTDAPKQPVRTMLHDVEGMKSGKPFAPFISSAKEPSHAVTPPSMPPVVPPIKMPTPPLPPHSVSAPLPPKNTAPSHEEVSNSLKEYGIDPYREPVE